MLEILFSIVILIPVLMGFGFLAESLGLNKDKSISLRILFGMLIITLFSTVLAFFYPLNLMVESIILLSGLATFFYFKAYVDLIHFCRANSMIMLLGTGFLCFFSSFYPFILDHFGYYVPTIKWISEVGLVKGIGNLDLLLAQTSLWHIFQSTFSHFVDHNLRLNVMVGFIFMLYGIEKKQWLFLVLLPFAYLFIQTPSPDLPAAFLSLILVNEVVGKNINSNALIVLSLFIFGIKPTFIWAPMFVILYSLFIHKPGWTNYIAGLLVLSLILFKNTWVFGYPVFPVDFPNLGLSWSPNTTLMRESAEMAILKTYDLQYSTQEITQFTTWDHIKNWLTLPGIKGVINSAFILCLFILGIFAFVKKQAWLNILFITIIFKSIVVLLFSAQYRFFLEVFPILLLVIFRSSISKKASLIGFTLLSTVAAIFFSYPNFIRQTVPSFRLGNFMLGFDKNQILRASVYHSEKYTVHQIGNLKFNLVKNYPFSYDTPLPAISPSFLQSYLDAGIFPQKIGTHYLDGFQWRKMTQKEQSELKIIIGNWEYQNNAVNKPR